MSLSPNLFVDPYQNPFVNTVDNNGTRRRGNIIDSATATTGQAITNAGTLASKAIYNGEGWYFEQAAQMVTGSTTDYNFLHDGSNFDIWLTVFICPTNSTTYQRAFVCNNGFSTTSRGILLRANATTGNNRLDCNIGNGSASMITLGANGALTVNSTNRIRIVRNGSTATMFVNGIQVATQTIVAASGVGAAAGVMTLGTILGQSANFYLKDLVIFNRALTTNEVAKMNSRTFASIVPEPINVYLLAGDSNCAGRGLNSEASPDLFGALNNTLIPNFPASFDQTTYIEKLQLGKNQTMISESPTTQHGAEMRFAKNMSANGDIAIIKYGIGSAPVIRTASVSDWNIASPSALYNRWRNIILPTAIGDIVHGQRRTPVFRGFIWTQGANDAVIGGSTSWTRSGTTITCNEGASHGLITGMQIPIIASNDLVALPLGTYAVTVLSGTTFSIVGVNAGNASGTMQYSAGANYKVNVTAIINGTLDALSVYRNQITNTTGYTVNKLRLYFVVTKSGATSFDPTSYAQTSAAQVDMGVNYRTDNPSQSSRVIGSTSQSTEALPTSDLIHYTTAGYNSLGALEDIYFSQFRNE